ncbi:glucosidase [Lithospermum erythrorhizon]|uniref:Glucosidase n=1 Tax=Lithospermum erythrorhizon TaxID=34254 RepID=A0AAV3PHC8_LITER
MVFLGNKAGYGRYISTTFQDLHTTRTSNWLNMMVYIVSDCDAVAIIHDDQGYVKEPEDVVDVLKAGMDLNCGSYLLEYTKSAVAHKNLSTTEIDRALHNLFSVRMRLGLLNGDPKKQAFGDIVPNVVCSKEHQQLALEAERSGLVPMRILLDITLSFLSTPLDNCHFRRAM